MPAEAAAASASAARWREDSTARPSHGARSGKAEDAHGHRTGHLYGIEPFHLAGRRQRLVHGAAHAVLHHLHHVVSALLAHAEHRGCGPAALAQRRRALIGPGNHGIALVEGQSIQRAGGHASGHAPLGHLGRAPVAQKHLTALAPMTRGRGRAHHGTQVAAHATRRVQRDEARFPVDRHSPRGAHLRARRLGAVHAASAGRFPYRAAVGQRALEARHGKRRLLVQHGRPPERARRLVL